MNPITIRLMARWKVGHTQEGSADMDTVNFTMPLPYPGETPTRRIKAILAAALDTVGLKLGRVESTSFLRPGLMLWYVHLPDAGTMLTDVVARIAYAFNADVTLVSIEQQAADSYRVGFVIDIANTLAVEAEPI